MKHLVKNHWIVDLRECEEGDILISQHGVILQYVKHNKGDYYPHEVKYIYDDGLTETYGSRLDDGYCYKNKRLETDHDIKRIVKKEVFKRYLRILSNKI
jgi:hypothetical protein